MSTSNLTQFSGDKAAFPPWELAVFDLAEGASALHPRGCLPDTMPDAAYEALGYEPYVPIPPPGPEPVQGEEELTKNFTLRYHRWESHRTRYELQTSQLKSVKQAVILALRAAALQLITHPLTGTRGYTLKEIMTRLRAAYGTMSSADITDNLNKCKVPFVDGNKLTEHIGVHVASHTVGAANNAVENEQTKIRNLTESLAACGLYGAIITLWCTQNPVPELQTFTSFSTFLLAYDQNRAATVTSSSAGFSANAAVEDDALFAARVKAVLGNSVQQKTEPPKKEPSKKTFCWSHGATYHNGYQCNHPSQGHKPEATFENKMGGGKKQA